jgi:paraquat-inducible protein B
MSKPVNKTAIGIFVVGAIALIVVAVIVIGSGKLFKDNQKFVLVFGGSVKGLSVGSPVVFRGVKVGEVTGIRMRYMPQDKSILIPVIVELGEGNMAGIEATKYVAMKVKERQREFVGSMIKEGLRAQLEMQSIVTGQLQIALDLYPEKPAKLIGGVPAGLVEIPTIPTNLQELAEKVGKIPFEEIFDKLRKVAEGIDRTVNSPEMTRLVKSLAQGADNGNVLIENINREVQPLAAEIRQATQEIKNAAKQAGSQIEPLAASVKKTSDEAAATLKKAQSAINNIDNMTGDDSAVAYRLTKTLGELELAARSLRVLTETLEHQPESVIFGKKQTRRN